MDDLKATGIDRIIGKDNELLVSFNRGLSDEELVLLTDALGDAGQLVNAVRRAVARGSRDLNLQ